MASSKTVSFRRRGMDGMPGPERAQDGWERLSRKFGSWPFFPHGLAASRRCDQRLVISTPVAYRMSRFRNVVLCAIGYGAMVAVLGYFGIVRPYRDPPLFGAAVILLPLALLNFLSGLGVRRLEFPSGGSEVSFIWGYVGLSRRVSLRCAGLQATLKLGGRSDPDGPALTAEELRLSWDGHNGAVCLATAEKQGKLRQAYEALAGLGGMTAADETCTDVTLPDGATIRLSLEPMESTPLIPGEIQFVSSAKATSQPSAGCFLLSLLPGLPLLAIAVIEAFVAEPTWPVIAVFGCGVILWLGDPLGLRRRFVVDRDAGLLLFRGRFGGWQRRPLKDMAALQLCSYCPPTKYRHQSYEINLVEGGPHSTRLPLSTSRDLDTAWKEAQQLVELLGLPLIDHAGLSEVLGHSGGHEGAARQIVRTPMGSSETSLRLRVCFASAGVARTRRVVPTVILSATLLLYGIAFAAGSVVVAVRESAASGRSLLGLVVGASAVLLGAIVLRSGLRWLTLDRPAGSMRIPRGLWRWENHDLSQVKAVQFCRSLRATSARPTYEINMVMDSPWGERVPFLATGASPEAARWDAEHVADMLAVPLLDHTGEEAMLKRFDLAGGTTLHFSRYQVAVGAPTTDAGRLCFQADHDWLSGRRIARSTLVGAGTMFTFSLLLLALLIVLAARGVWVVLGLALSSLLYAFVGVLGTIEALRRPVADRSTATVRLPRGALCTESIPFGNVAAAQLCAARTSVLHRPYVELVLVLREEPVRRVLFHTRRMVEDARADGEDLAKFLGAPLLDHTT